MPRVVDQPVPPSSNFPLGLWGRLSRTALNNAREALNSVDGEVSARWALRPTAESIPDSAGPRALSSLSTEECFELLRDNRLGRLAFIGRQGVPLIVPVNYEVVDEAVVIHSGPGPKLQAAERREVVSLEVDDVDQARRSGWSVVVTGKAERLPDTRESGDGVAWPSGPRSHVIRVEISRIAGRRLSSGRLPGDQQEPTKEA